MRDVREQQRADLVRDRAEPAPVDDPRVGREAGNHELRPVLSRERRDAVVVDLPARRVDVVRTTL